MADWDSPDLKDRCVRHRRRPATDEGTDPDDWYALLTEAEAHWKPVLATHYPNDMFSAPVQLTSADGGYTYTLPSSEVDPLALLVLSSATGRPLKPGPYWDRMSDYVLEEGRIRMTLGRAVSFADGPYARYVTGPASITAGVESTIKPKRARLIIVYHACMLDAMRGGMDDPSPYEKEAQWTAFGNPSIPGDVGIIGSLKKRDSLAGMAAFAGGGEYAWWRPNG